MNLNAMAKENNKLTEIVEESIQSELNALHKGTGFIPQMVHLRHDPETGLVCGVKVSLARDANFVPASGGDNEQA